MDSDPPDGWRYPLERQSGKRQGHDRFATAVPKVSADFDGDGIVDSALLLKSTVFTGQGLLVKLSSAPGNGWLVLDEIDWEQDYPSAALVMNIGVSAPGTLRTACGRGIRECRPGEAEQITFETPALIYSRTASASSVFHWDKTSLSFKRSWLSD